MVQKFAVEFDETALPDSASTVSSRIDELTAKS
jgi:hypothetical protein